MAKHERPTLAALIETRKAETRESDAAAARSCGVSQGTFTRWRSGLLTPTTTARRDALAAWLGVTSDVVTLAVEQGRRKRPDRPSLAAVVTALAAQVDALAAQVEALSAARDASERPAAPSTPRRLPPNVRPLPPTRR